MSISKAFFMLTTKTLIRLGGSESSLGAHSFCWVCHEAAHIYVQIIMRLVATGSETDRLSLL